MPEDPRGRLTPQMTEWLDAPPPPPGTPSPGPWKLNCWLIQDRDGRMIGRAARPAPGGPDHVEGRCLADACIMAAGERLLAAAEEALRLITEEWEPDPADGRAWAEQLLAWGGRVTKGLREAIAQARGPGK